MQPRSGGDLTTHEDLEMDETSLQMVEQMEMVPIGKIEDVAKQEIRQRRRSSLSRGPHDGARY